MGGFFGAVSKHNAIGDVFFGTDFHSHLGTKRGGIAAYDEKIGMQRDIHNIEKTPFRTKFDKVFEEMTGNSAIGCISDSDPQPLLIRSNFCTYAISIVGRINNADELISQHLAERGHFSAMTGGRVNSVELVASLINSKSDLVEGIKFAQSVVKGSVSILILKDDGSIITARDRLGRLPVNIGKNDDGYCVSMESFVYKKLDYDDEKELGPGEIVQITKDSITQLAKPGNEMKICSFLWTYYGYPTSTYEGVNVEVMRNRNGEIMADNDKMLGNIDKIDYVGGIPDSGTPHAVGYANKCDIPFARPFIKYTPTWSRSFMPPRQADRNRIAKMKLIPVHDLIMDKNLLFVDDSIVRGTQLKETVDFLYDNGAKSVHMRSACPPIMHSCKYLNFSSATSDMDLIARRIILELEGEEGFNHLEEYSDATTERGKNLRKTISDKFGFASLEFQSLEGLIKSIGIDRCKICTYCYNGKE